MPDTPAAPRRARPHGVLWDFLFSVLRVATKQLHGVRAAVGAVLLVGVAIAAAGTAAFAWVATWVRAGRTQWWDEEVMQYIARHRIPWLEAFLLEVTFLGTATVVIVLSGVAALFLALTRHKASAALLLCAAAGSVILNNVLKSFFDRPRPQLFTWGTHALTTSFPSGHAMSAATVYATVAYLAARLHRGRRGRRGRAAIYATAALFIVAISASRLYLGVHYPSDVFAGLVIGLAWAGFCMATLEAVQWKRARGGQRRAKPALGDASGTARPPERPHPPTADRPSRNA